MELIKAKHPESQGWLRRFWMEVYCFPDPTDRAQRIVIRQIGSEENELQATFIKMCDADKLITCRRNLQDVSEELTGLFIFFFISLGADLHLYMGNILGVLKAGSGEVVGTVKTL